MKKEDWPITEQEA